jgi:endonuclease/exonuclease/phosphatase family metal-dependent hydrolase
MRIATFNLESFDAGKPGRLEGEERIAILRPSLNRLDADVLCLQEVNGQKIAGHPGRYLTALDALLKGTQYETYNRFSTRGPGQVGVGDVHNLVILSRSAIRDACEFWHQFVKAPTYEQATADPPQETADPITWDRPVLSATVALAEGRNLHVLNVHLRAPLAAPVAGQKLSPFVWRSVGGWAEGYFIAAVKRLGQALEIRLYVEEILKQDPQALIAVCGDFNADDHDTVLDVIAGAEEDTGNGRLAANTLAQADRSIAQDRRFSVLHHGRPQMMDHIFASRTLLGALRKVEIHNEMLEDELVGYAKVQRSLGSYHAPVVAEFAL